ncbi:MAG: hypothetical protein AABZ08_06710 [Planctomycetota bacterium]
MFRAFCPVIAVMVLAGSAQGQSFNINIAPPGVVPPASYGGAGQPGVWNSVTTNSGVYTNGLLDINGTPTGVRFIQIGGFELRVGDDPGTSGADDALMDDCLVTYSPTLETCLYVRDIQIGIYEVIVYAMMPSRPDVMSYVSSNEEPGYPHKVIGGGWPGYHKQGVTYSRHICYVDGGGTYNQIQAHSGIVPGNPAADGAATNGFQIRLLPPQATGDMNCDGAVNAGDIEGFVKAITSDESYSLAHALCNITNADTNLDRYRDAADVPGFVNALLAP